MIILFICLINRTEIFEEIYLRFWSGIPNFQSKNNYRCFYASLIFDFQVYNYLIMGEKGSRIEFNSIFGTKILLDIFLRLKR